MQTNAVPTLDTSVNTTGCCPKFNPDGWDARELQFRDKPFVRATTKSKDHVPLDMDQVFGRVMQHIEDADVWAQDAPIVLSRDLDDAHGEHLFAIREDAEITNEQTVALSGDFFTKVCEGDYTDGAWWQNDLEGVARAHGGTGDEVYFYYTTCPKCAEAYGKNYVVGFAKV